MERFQGERPDPGHSGSWPLRDDLLLCGRQPSYARRGVWRFHAHSGVLLPDQQPQPRGSVMSDKYEVTDVNERRRFTPGGKEQTFVHITIRTTRGSTGSVRIPVADYNAENVKTELDNLAEQLDMPFGV